MTTKKTNAKPETKKKPAKKPGKRADTSPAEKPAEKKGKAKRAADAPRGRKAAKTPEAAEAPAQATPAAATSTSPLDAPAPAEAPKAEGPRAPTPVREPIPGSRLALALRYACIPTPERDGSVVFDATREGWPFIHGHGMKAAHKAFLPVKCDCALTLCAVERGIAERLVKLLGSLRGASVRIDATGRCTIKHAAGQPELHYELDPRPFCQDYEPPVDREATASYVPLRIDGSMHARATRWPESVVEMRQTRGGVEWITITAREGGELLAQAVLAEDGHDLYPEDERQTSIPGSRAVKAASDRDGSALLADYDAYLDRQLARAAQAGPAPLPPRPAPPPAPARPPFPSLRDDGRAALRIDRRTWQSIPGTIAGHLAELPWVVVREDDSYVVLAAMNAAEVAAVAELLTSAGLRCTDVMAGADAETWFVAGPPPEEAATQPEAPPAENIPAPPDDPAPTAPTPGAFPAPKDDVQVVLDLTAAAWAHLDERTRAMLSELSFLCLAEVGDGEHASSPPLAAAEVAAVVPILAAEGLRCADVTEGDPDDEERFEQWTVDVAPAPGELAPFPTPGERPVVFEVPEAVWAGLSSVQVRALDGLAAQATPAGVEPWYRIADAWRTGPMTAAVAVRLGRRLASWGFRCEEKGGESRRDGVVVDLWRVGKMGERKGAAV